MRNLLAFLFVVASLPAATVGPTDRYLPLIQDGGWSTQVTLINLSRKPILIYTTFLTAEGYNETWGLEMKASVGIVNGTNVDTPLAPGAMATIETSGKPGVLTRGFAEIIEVDNQPIGVFATLTQKDGERVVQRFNVPLSLAHERRSLLPLDLTDASVKPEMVWVSFTSSAQLDIFFRDSAGQQILVDQVFFDNKAQIFLNIREHWPQRKDFRGTMEWSVSFPAADRYEPRTLGGICINAKEGQGSTVSTGLTAPGDQASISPYQ